MSETTTKATHTPGPWAADLVSGSFYIVTDSGRTIAVRTRGINESREEVDANARLIAAAPDLLEAAKHAAMEWRLHGQLTDSCRVLEAAIKKAEG